MIVLKLVINIISSFLQVLIFDRIFSACGIKKMEGNLVRIIIYGVYSLMNGLIVTFVDTQIVYLHLSIGTILLFLCSYIYTIKLQKRIFIVIIIMIISIVIEVVIGMITVAALNISVVEAQSNLSIYLINALFSKLILLGLLFSGIRLVKNKYNIKLEWQLTAMLIALPIASFAIIVIMARFVIEITSIYEIVQVSIASILLLFSNIAIFFLFSHIEKMKNAESKMQLYTMQTAMEKEYYQDMIKNYKDTNKTYHDLKNKLFAIDTLLNEDVKKASEEIKKTCHIVESVQNMSYSQNIALDALINSKMEQMKQYGVEMKVAAFLSEKIKCNDIDLCIICGNLIDNAINATKELQENKSIALDIKHNNDKLIITIKNPISEEHKKTKHNKYLHGYGLKNIQEIVDRLNGEFQYGKKEAIFIATVII